MKNQLKGMGFYLVMLLIIFGAVYFSEGMQPKGQTAYNESAFVSDLAAGKENISYIDIYQNEEVPTGEVVITFKDNTQKGFNVTDTRDIEDEIVEHGIVNYEVHSISKPSWVITTLLPYLFGFAAIMFLFSFMTNQAGGGGGGNS